MSSTEQFKPRKIHSFIRRQGRVTPGQQQALNHYRDKYCLDPQKNYDFSELFSRNAPTIFEIGFGNGESLATMALNNPEQNYIGVEVHTPGVGHLILKLEQLQLTNVRIYQHDAVEILEQRIADDSLAGVHLFFPDPWPKKKHHKRRIVQPDFIKLITFKLQSGGYFHAATDWENYAKQMLQVLSVASGLVNTDSRQSYFARPDDRPVTKFEKRGLRLGHGVWDLIFKKL